MGDKFQQEAVVSHSVSGTTPSFLIKGTRGCGRAPFILSLIPLVFDSQMGSDYYFEKNSFVFVFIGNKKTSHIFLLLGNLGTITPGL